MRFVEQPEPAARASLGAFAAAANAPRMMVAQKATLAECYGQR